ncbi:MAG: TIR domain-containing protein [Devosia sp.]
MGKIFISHSSVNNAEALAIDDWLHEQGWADTFLDLDPRRGLVAGERWQAALKSAAESCELILIVISPDWAASRWCLAEFLLAKQMNKQIVGVVVQPTPYDTLPPELTAEWQLVDLTQGKMGWSKTIEPPRLPDAKEIAFSENGLARLGAGLQKAGLDPSHFPWPPAHDLGRAPYRGLLPLDADDAGIFFGRDGMIVLTLDGLRGLRARAAPRFATVLGASGAGKSSFLRAGLLPRLSRDSAHFHVLPIVRPERAALTGEHGLAAALIAALAARGITKNRAEVRNAVLGGVEAVSALLKQIAVPVGDAPDVPATLVLSVDQAEELLEPGDAAAEAGPFLQLLADLSRRDEPPLMVVFTIRSDNYGRLQDRVELEGTKPHHLIDLSPMPAGSYGDVIRGPARRLAAAGKSLELDEPLVDALLEDIHQGGGKDALPLLAFTLERLFHDYGSDGDLKLSEYDDLGRIRGAIEAAIAQALKAADGISAIPADRAARLALLRRGLIPWLAGIDPDTRAPRRRVARFSEVPEEARPLMQLMVEQRLLSTDKDEATGETTIEPAHEALLRQWGALDGWLVEDSADLAQLEAVRRAATDWAANAKAAEFLIHKGSRLGAAEAAADQDKFEAYLNSTDREYLRGARDAENATVRAAMAARLRTMVAAAVVGAVLIIGGVVGYFVWSSGQAAKVQAEVNFLIAQSEAALRAGKPEEGAKAALAAYELAPSTASRTAALSAAMAVPPNSLGIRSSPGLVIDARWVAESLITLAADGSVVTDNASNGTRTTAKVPADTQPVGLLPTGASVQVVYADGGVFNLDGSVAMAAPPDGFFGQAGTLRSSADGKVFGITGLIGDALLRDCRSLPCIDRVLVPPATIGSGSAGAMAISPNGDGVAVSWNPGNLAIYRSIADEPMTLALANLAPGMVTALDWSTAGKLLIVTSEGNVTLLDLTGADATVQSMGKSIAAAWSPAASVYALGCDDHTICLYDDQGLLVDALTGHKGSIGLIRWSADGTHLASIAPGEPLRLWSAQSDRQVAWGRSVTTHNALTALAIDHAHNRTLAGDEIGPVWTWEADGAPVSYRSGTDDIARVASLALLPDGKFAAVHENRNVAFYTPGKADPDRLIGIDNASFSRIAALTGDIRAAVPLTDGRIITFSGDDLRQSEVAPDSMKLTPWGIAAARAPNEAFISYSDGSIRRRNLGTGAEGVTVFDASKSICGETPTTDNNGAKSLDVSDDGKWLVATRTDAKVIVHNLADPDKPVCMDLLAPDSKTVAFSPDSSLLAILSATDRLYVFDLEQPGSAIILGAAAVPDNSPLAIAAGPARTTSWLDWVDDRTLAIATTAGAVEMINLDPASWRARVDSLIVAQ